MAENLDNVESFGAKLNSGNSDIVDEISEQIDAMDASGGEPPEGLEDVFSLPQSEPVFKTRIKSSYRPRPAYTDTTPAPVKYERPEGTPQPLLIICEDPNYCPPPVPTYPRYPPYRPKYGAGPGLTLCRDPKKYQLVI